MWLAQMDAWISAEVTCLTESKASAGHRKKIYANGHISMVQISMEHSTRNNPPFLE